MGELHLERIAFDLRGFINTLDYVSELAGMRRFAAVVGGTHLVDAHEACGRRMGEALAAFAVGKLAPCHCTGFDGQMALCNRYRDRFVANAAGTRLEFG